MNYLIAICFSFFVYFDVFCSEKFTDHIQIPLCELLCDIVYNLRRMYIVYIKGGVNQFNSVLN